ncbi:MAG: hypothetical protein J5612_06155 [Paludibacteraceae bacterium]|nr:hypothetical protein [Paludibacteraceae bacterium]
MKKLFLLMVAAVCSLTMSAKLIFLDTGGTALWGQDNATFFIWSWGETPGALHAMSPIAGDIYAADIDDGETYLLFARLPEGTTEETFDWAKAMNQTDDLEIPTSGEQQYIITGWAGADGYWTFYAPSAVCTYQLKMIDTYGDGWNGGELTVIDAAIEQTFTLSSGYEQTVNVEAYGGTPQWIFTKGSYPSEIGYVITDVNGLVLAFHTAGTTHEMEFTTADPCETRTAPALPSYVQVNTEDNISFSFEWEAVAGVDNYYVMILNPGNNVSLSGVVAGNTLSRDLSDRTINGTYTIEVIPANADGLPYYEHGTTETFELKLPAVGIVKTRFFVPSDSELDMTQTAVIGLEGTDGGFFTAEATQEAGTRWWSAEVDVDAPAYYYAQMMVGNTEATTVYVPYTYITSSKETELCLTVGSWESDYVDGGITYKYYYANFADCDMKEYQIASVTLTPGEGEFYYTIVPDGEQAPRYNINLYVEGSYYGGVTVSNLEGRINVNITSDRTFSGFTVTPYDEYSNKVGATYESTVPFTITPSPYNITGLSADPVGDNTYAITWDVPSKLPPLYWVYIEDADGNVLLEKTFDASELTQDAGKFVLTSPAFAVEGTAYVEVDVQYGEDDWGPWAYINFDVSGLVSISDATIRVLIPTDNNMDISNGVWFWWWPVGETTGTLVKATPESGRWFSADIQPNALGYQFLVVNQDVVNDGWTDAQQSYDSRACGAGISCLALASKYTYNSKHSLYDVECNAPDHDYRPTLSFDNSVAQKITVTAEAKEYAPNYEIAWRVKDSGDDFKYQAHHMTATNHTFTLDFPVTEDTEYEYRYYVNDEDWHLMVENINGTFTVKATGAEPEYPPFNLEVTVEGQVAKLTWSAPLEVEYCVLNVIDPLTSTDVVYEDVPGVAGDYSYEYTFADGDERTLKWGVFSRIGYKAVSGWVYGDDFQAGGGIPAYYNIDNLTATPVGDNTYKISWDVKSGVYQYYVFVEDADGNTMVEDAFLASELSVEGDKYVLITPAFAVEGEASAHVWSGDNVSNWYKDATVLFDVTGLSKLTSSKIRVLIPTDNNMDISSGVWFWWWEAGTTTGQLVEATPASGRWFEADITLNAAGYQFLVVNKEINSDADWVGAQQSEDSPLITTDEACFEQVFNANILQNWKLAPDAACDHVDHDFRFSITMDNSVPGKLTIDVSAEDYAPVYSVGVALKGSTDDYVWTKIKTITASEHTATLALGLPDDAVYNYIVVAYSDDMWQLAEAKVGEVTILANPDVPENLKAQVEGKDVTFSWTPRGTDYTHFRLRIFDMSLTLYHAEDNITAASKVVTIEDNASYLWFVDAYNGTELLATAAGPSFTVNYVPATTYTLTIAADAHGSVNTAVNGTYNEGDVVKIIATPDDGYKFDKWSDDDTHATRNITMNKDYNLTAYFTKDEGGGGGEDPDYYTLTVEVDPAGAATVYFDGDKVKKNELEVEEGTVVTLTFEEEEGYEFDYWQDGKSKVTKSKYKVTVNDDMTIILHMIPAQAIENVEDATKPTKVLRNGTIYIFREGKTYTITGAKVE